MSDPIATFQGLATGIQYRDLVDQIIAAESRPLTLIQSSISDAQRRSTAWSDFRLRVQSLYDRAGDLSDLGGLQAFRATLSRESVASVTAGSGALTGSFSLEVEQLATREKVGSDFFTSRSEALGLEGEFVVNGRAVSLTSNQSLEQVAATINAANTGIGASGVGASVVGSTSEGFRLVLTAQGEGVLGMQLFDGATGLLQSMGILDASRALRHRTSDGAMSRTFGSPTATVAALGGLSAPPAGTVQVGGFDVAVDLGENSLQEISDAINAAAAAAGSAVSSRVAQETGTSGDPVFRLDISGTTSFVDQNSVLETLGLLERGRSAEARSIQGAAFTGGDGTTAATGTTLLTDLWSGGTDRNVQVGDTLDLQGTRGDGSTFTTSFTVATDSTYQNLVDTLNDVTDGFGAGSRTATAGIDGAGRLVVTDDIGGASALSLSVFTNNQGGGTLDFGDFSVVTAGRDRELVAGRDAVFTIDGQRFTRSRNTVSDVVEGVTLTLKEAGTGPTTVQVARDLDTAAKGVEDFVKAMNSMLEFVNSQFTGVGEGELRRPLSGDGVIRGMRAQLKDAFETTLASAFGGLDRMGTIGVEIQRDGTYTFDGAAFRNALETNPDAVERLFGVSGVGTTSALGYVSSTTATRPGSWAVEITQAAERAVATTSGFAGYVDDGVPDILSVTDAGSGAVYDVALNAGDTAADIAQRLNAAFSTATARQLQAADALHADAGGTPAGAGTLLRDLHSPGGTGLGVADGDTLTLSGTDDDGNSFLSQFTVADVTTQTLGDLEAAVEEALGGDVDVSFEDGVLTAISMEARSRSFTLSITSDNAGGGSFSVGGISTVTDGRGATDLVASAEGGELSVVAADHGAGQGFDVAYAAGGTDGTSSLGLAAGSYRGVDVAGTIGGEAATGSGQALSGAVGSAAEGLVISYTGADTGKVGDFSFARGIAALVEQVSDGLLDSGGGIDGVTERIDDQVRRFNDRMDFIEDRLERRRRSLIDQFSRLEETIARAQARGQFLASQLASLAPAGGASGLQG